jgi:hypothetical protein
VRGESPQHKTCSYFGHQSRSWLKRDKWQKPLDVTYVWLTNSVTKTSGRWPYVFGGGLCVLCERGNC